MSVTVPKLREMAQTLNRVAAFVGADGEHLRAAASIIEDMAHGIEHAEATQHLPRVDMRPGVPTWRYAAGVLRMWADRCMTGTVHEVGLFTLSGDDLMLHMYSPDGLTEKADHVRAFGGASILKELFAARSMANIEGVG